MPRSRTLCRLVMGLAGLGIIWTPLTAILRFQYPSTVDKIASPYSKTLVVASLENDDTS
jgi:hypothetical protein